MKTRFTKALILPGAMLYVLAAAYTPMNSAATRVVISDQSTDPSDDPPTADPSTPSDDPFNPMSTQSLPFPVCPQCTDDMR